MTNRISTPGAARNLPLVAAIAMLASACGECIGTPSCRVDPEVSYTGQIVDHATGLGVADTRVTFVRDSGILIDSDSIDARTNGEGHFLLRQGTAADGAVHGHVRIAPPAPFEPYTIPDISLEATRTRGDGAFLGRFVARPFFRFIGLVRDRNTQRPLQGVTVKWRRNSGGRLSQDSATFVSDFGGMFTWNPEVLEVGTINATVEVTAPGHPRTYRFTRNFPLHVREGETILQPIPVGMGIAYYAAVIRRGLGLPLDGTSVELTRVAGVATQPTQLNVVPNRFGSFDIAMAPQSAGSLFVQMRVKPPSPLPEETVMLAMATSDDELKVSLGVFGYGAQAGFRAELQDSATGARLPDQTPVRIRRVSGLALQWPTPPPPEGDFRVVNSRGEIAYGAPTSEVGTVTYDVTVQLPAPFQWDTIRGIVAQSRYNDTLPHLGALKVRRRPRP